MAQNADKRLRLICIKPPFAVQAKVESSMFFGKCMCTFAPDLQGLFFTPAHPVHFPAMTLLSGTAMHWGSSYIYVNTDCCKVPDEWFSCCSQ